MDTEYLSPSPCNLGRAAISSLAENLAVIAKFGPGADIEDFVEHLGGTIHYQDFWNLDESESGSIVISDKNDFDIRLASHTSKQRDRFTIAHELGHFFLHYRLPQLNGIQMKPMRAARYGGDTAEVEANWFAAALLMPAKEFEKSLDEENGVLPAVAAKFGVSVSAASVRARSLNLSVSRSTP